MLEPHLKHQRIRAALLADITEGRLRPGDPLPTEHRLAETMKVSRSTVRQTFGALEREGLIRRVRGKGTFVAERNQGLAPQPGPPPLAISVPSLVGGFCCQLVTGFEQAANLAGRAAVVCNTGDKVDRQANYFMRLIDQRVGGLAMVPSSGGPTPGYQLRLVQAAGIPVLLLHQPLADVAAPCVQSPEMELAQLAGQTLAELGHRRLLVLAPQRSTLATALETGLSQTADSVVLHVPDPPIPCHPWGEMSTDDCSRYIQHLERSVPALLQIADRPTAVVAVDRWAAEATYLIAREAGLRTPQDLSLLYVGGARRECVLLHRFAAVVVDEAEIGRLAVQCLLEMEANRRSFSDERSVSVRPSLVPGETLGPAPAVC